MANIVCCLLAVAFTSYLLASSDDYGTETVILVFLTVYEFIVLQVVILFLFARRWSQRRRDGNDDG